jgi:hypothetical protein
LTNGGHSYYDSILDQETIMPIFKQNEPIETTVPRIEFTLDPARPLPPGRHTFRLIVEDDAGNRSQASEASVIIRDTINPTAVLSVPQNVEPGQNFTLDGVRSSDVAPGKVAKYIWTWVQ